jgi:malto-oligosyltrehalose trehalohydrolase
MVFLDVVYNHFGPEGNFLPLFAPAFFTERHATPWGTAIDFEGSASRPVRDFFIHNALYWIEEYHLDGLRLDAVDAIHDASEPDFLSELAHRVRQQAGPEQHVHLVLENDRNEAWRLERDGDGRPRTHTAQWNDDLHHALHVLVTDEATGYYEDYAAEPARLLGRCLTEGFAYQGEPSRHREGAPRGEPSAHLPPTAFVAFLQNHDQVGNRALGERIDRLAPVAAVEAALALLLLAPSTPLLFMGEEWGADEPFPFFCDFGAELAEKVREGRRREFASFPEFRDPATRARIPDPGAPATFESARLDRTAPEREPHRSRLALVRRLLALRAREIAPRLARIQGRAGGFETCGERGLRARWRLGDGASLHLLAQLGSAPLEKLAGGPSPGRRLFASHADIDGWLEKTSLPPWSVLWQLEEADRSVPA